MKMNLKLQQKIMKSLGNMMMTSLRAPFAGLLVLLATFFTGSVQAADFNAALQDVYYGTDDQGKTYYYLHGKEVFVLIHGDISVPIKLPRKPSMLLSQSWSSSWFNDVYIYNRPITFVFNDPVYQELTDTEIAARGLTRAVKGIDFFIADFNGDGFSDLFVRGVGPQDSSALYLGTEGSQLPILQKNYYGSILDGVRLSDRSIPLTVEDVNGDGKADLSFYSGSNNAYAYLSGAAFVEIAERYYPQNATNGGSTLPINIPNSETLVTVGGQPDVKDNGASSYTVPLSLPGGIGGMQPSLAFSYNSMAGNGQMGIGWSLGGIGMIGRCPPNIALNGRSTAKRHSASELFCLDGQQLKLVSGSYGANGAEYRTQNRPFDKIVSYGGTAKSPSYFKVWSKSGVVTTYGEEGQSNFGVSHIVDIIANNPTYEYIADKWGLNKVADRFGNYYSVSYVNDISLGHFYVDEVKYTGNEFAGSIAPYNLKFNYVDRDNYTNSRNDDIYSLDFGPKYQIDTVLESVVLSYSGKNVSRYNLAYDQNSTSGRLRLDEIKHCAFNEEGFEEECSLPLALGWSDGEEGFEVPQSLNISVTPKSGTRPQALDADGDGLVDLVWVDTSNRYVAAFGNGAGFDAPVTTNLVAGKYFGVVSPVPLYALEGANYSRSNRSQVVVDYREDQTTTLSTGETFDRGFWAGIHISRAGAASYTLFTEAFSKKLDPSIASNCSAPIPNGDAYVSSIPKLVDISGTGMLKIFRDTKLYSHQRCPDRWSSLLHTVSISLREYAQWPFNSNSRSAISPNISFNADSAKFFDFDNDGDQDILVEKDDGTMAILNNQGRSSELGILDGLQFLSFSINLPKGDGENGNGFLLDMNADGLTDYVVKNGTWKIYLNSGGGYPNSFSTVIDTNISSGANPADSIIVDYDGNGLPDMLVRHPSLNQWRLLRAITQDVSGSLQPNFETIDIGMNLAGLGEGVTFSGELFDTYKRSEKPFVADINSDGLADILYREGSVWKVALKRNRKADLLEKVEDNIGNEVQFKYAALSDRNVHEAGAELAFPMVAIQAPIQLVSEMLIRNDVGGLNSFQYSYKGGRYHAQGLGFLGFEERTQKDLLTHQVKVTKYHQQYPRTGLVYDEKTYFRSDFSTEGQLLSHQTASWITQLKGNINVPLKEFDTSSRFELDGTPVYGQRTDYEFDEYGSLTYRTTKEGTSLSNAEVVGEEYSATIDNIYTNDSAAWLLGFLEDSTITTSAIGKPDAITKTHFVQYPATLAISSKTDYYEDADNWLTTDTSQRNQFGSVTSIEVEGYDVSRYVSQTFLDFDALQRPRTISNAKGHETKLDYDHRFGAVKSQTDANMLVSQFTYNNFGQLLKQTLPNGSVANTVYLSCSESTCVTDGAYRIMSAVTHSSEAGRVASPPATTTYSASGKPLLVETVSIEGKKRFVKTQYNAWGQKRFESLPFFEGEPEKFTEYQYDSLGRVKDFIEQSGTLTHYDYSASSLGYATQLTVSTTVTDPSGLSSFRSEVQHFDVRGQLKEKLDAEGTLTEYEYNAQGLLNLTRVNSDTSTQIITTYDDAGNVLTVADPDHGLSVFTYDGLGLQRTSTDANGWQNVMTYDRLGRMTLQTNTEASYSWVYDTAADGSIAYGQLLETRSSHTIERYSYDALMQVKEIGTEFPLRNRSFNAHYSFDNFGRLKTRTYPSGFKVESRYANNGSPSKVVDASTQRLLWEAVEQDEFGNTALQKFGNNTATRRIYDASSGYLTGIQSGRVSSAGSTLSDHSIQNSTFAWDSIGNLYERGSELVNQPRLLETFSYDNLNRVRTSSIKHDGLAVNAGSYDFDALGNMTFKSDVGDYKYGQECATPAGRHAVCQITGARPSQYHYDLAGNMTSGGGKVITFNRSGKVTRVTKGAAATNFGYTAGGAVSYRFSSYTGGSMETYSVGGDYEEVISSNDSNLVQKSYVDGVVIHKAVRASAGGAVSSTSFEYLYQDHLGSLDVAANDSGAVVARYSFDLWGARRNQDWTALAAEPIQTRMQDVFAHTAMGFTGHQMIDEVELVHMGGRMYDPIIGRFISPDPFVQDGANSQSFNRYSYVMNNPLSLVDPSGYFWDWLFGDDDSEGSFGADMGDAWDSLWEGEFGYALDSFGSAFGLDFGGKTGYTTIEEGNTGATWVGSTSYDGASIAMESYGGDGDSQYGQRERSFWDNPGRHLPSFDSRALNFLTGVADSVSFGVGKLIRESYGIGDVDVTSDGYQSGVAASIFAGGIGTARLAYMGVFKLASQSRNLAFLTAASQVRNFWKFTPGLGLAWTTGRRPIAFARLIAEKGFERARTGLGRQDPFWNRILAPLSLGQGGRTLQDDE